MDGTLVESSLNFKKIRELINCPQEEDILRFVSQLPEQQKRESEDLIFQHERADAQQAKTLGKAATLLERIKELGLPIGIVTRNQPDAAKLKLNNNDIPFDILLTRFDAPPKPKPDALLQVAATWQLHPSELIYVGDYLYDVQAANHANMTSCLLAVQELPSYHKEADIVVKCLTELIP